MNDLQQLVVATAKTHGLDPDLVCAVVEQESAWNTWAIRHEPAFYARYVAPLGLTDTESVARSFSWGLMQLMGQVARELGYAGHLAALCEPSTGVEWGCRLLANKLREVNGDVHMGLERWNGGGNPNYAAEVIARMPKYAANNPPNPAQ
jgi:soluble lytic murein transglycosylase-like protein